MLWGKVSVGDPRAAPFHQPIRGDAMWDQTPVRAPSPAAGSGSHLKAVIPDVRLIQDAVLPVSPLPLSLPPSLPFVYIIIPQHSKTGLYYVRGK